jgi:DUF971 family protein
MADPRITPDHIGPTEDATALLIRWEDGAESVYQPRDLRLKCPCAACVDEMTGERILVPAMVPEGVYPLEIQYVGRYALQFYWSDSHSTGIYPFEYLRRLGDAVGEGEGGTGLED